MGQAPSENKESMEMTQKGLARLGVSAHQNQAARGQKFWVWLLHSLTDSPPRGTLVWVSLGAAVRLYG